MCSLYAALPIQMPGGNHEFRLDPAACQKFRWKTRAVTRHRTGAHHHAMRAAPHETVLQAARIAAGSDNEPTLESSGTSRQVLQTGWFSHR